MSKPSIQQKYINVKLNNHMSVNKMSDSERWYDENSCQSADTESDIIEELVNICKSLKRYRFEPEKEVITALAKVKMIQKKVMMGAKI